MLQLKDHPDITFAPRPNKRARRLTLRRDARSGGFTLSHPPRVRAHELQDFIDRQRDWILRHHNEIMPVGFGMEIPFRGGSLTITECAKRGVRRDGDQLHVKSVNPAASVASFLKSEAALYAPERLDHYAALLKQVAHELRWRDPKTRWGSCDNRGRIMLSWRLIMVPDAVFDYVIAHEVAHLAEMNHSPAFWAVVARLMPDYEVHRRWLRQNGNAIQHIVFK